jgi:pyruvate dehydrogenase E2 component (dihydrolipoamide acetyltransferase)
LAIIVQKKEDVEKFKSFKIDATENSKSQVGPLPKPPASAGEPKSSSSESKSPVPSSEPKSTVSESHSSQSGSRVIASPLAKNMAKTLGVNLSGIAGSGPNGRIVKSDVLGTNVTSTTPGTEYVDIPLSNMRKVIAQRLTESKQSIPHYYLTIDINMENITKLRARFNQKGTGEYKISVNDFIIKAAARAMGDVPEANSAWHGTFIRQFSSADISVAVATDSGLITPIIPRAELKGLLSISKEMRDLAGKARLNKLSPDQSNISRLSSTPHRHAYWPWEGLSVA